MSHTINELIARLEWIESNGSVLLSLVETRSLAALLPALAVDAQRWRGIRLALCEKDKDAQERMLEAIDLLMDAQGDIDHDKVTPELVDSLIDKMLLAVAEARNG